MRTFLLRYPTNQNTTLVRPVDSLGGRGFFLHGWVIFCFFRNGGPIAASSETPGRDFLAGWVAQFSGSLRRRRHGAAGATGARDLTQKKYFLILFAQKRHRKSAGSVSGFLWRAERVSGARSFRREEGVSAVAFLRWGDLRWQARLWGAFVPEFWFLFAFVKQI